MSRARESELGDRSRAVGNHHGLEQVELISRRGSLAEDIHVQRVHAYACTLN